MRTINILGVDFETQSIDPKTTNITEIGAVLKELTLGTNNCVVKERELARLSTLVWDPNYPPQSAEVVEVTGITDEMLKADSQPPKEALLELHKLMLRADVIFAHNTAFDKTVYNSQVLMQNLPPLSEKEWVCTYTEIPYPAKYRCKQLSHLALDHGLKMDHRQMHRATDDVELMLELLLQYDFTSVMEYAREPWKVLKADVSFHDKDKAKALGYSWEQLRGVDEIFPKTWVKRVKLRQVEQEKLAADFRVAVLR